MYKNIWHYVYFSTKYHIRSRKKMEHSNQREIVKGCFEHVPKIEMQIMYQTADNKP